MGVGSQRAMLESPGLAETYSVRDIAPNIFLLGNIGAAQLPGCKAGDIARLVESIGADGLAIHLNPAQELAQEEGDKDWKGMLESIRGVVKAVSFPVVVKEVGCGIAGRIAKQLESAGAAAIDVAGAGGTSWVKVDSHRSSVKSGSFSEWGIPTAEALRQCAKETSVPIIASGGIRNGLEIAKAIAMGASLAGLALPLLKPASESKEAVLRKIEELVNELKMAMFLVGAKNIEELSRAKYHFE
jgi:isopentenyl-diphosphate delta-isomerase